MIIRKLSDNTKVYIDRYFAIVDEMDRQMREEIESDSISELFINQIVSFVEGEIKMSENILNYTTNSNIETLAKQLVEEGKANIVDLKEMLEFCRNCQNDERDISLYMRRFTSILDNMISRMNNINVTNNIDHDYLAGLIAHHEGGVALAKNVLGYEICENLKVFAENMITTHELQLSQMNQLLRIQRM